MRIRLIALLLLASASLSCTPQPETETETETDDVKLQLSWQVSPEHAALLLGKKDIFPSYGINLSLIPSWGSNETISSAATGAYEFVIVSGESLVLARAKGVPIRSVFQLYRQSPAVVFSVDGNEIGSPGDLIGRTVGVIPTSTVTTQLSLILDKAGIPRSEQQSPTVVQYVPAVQGGTSQLEAGSIDALTHYWNYAPSRYEANGRQVSVMRFSDLGLRTYSAGLVVPENLIKHNNQLALRFVCALTDSIEQAIARPELALAAYLEQLPAPTEADEKYAALAIARTNILLQEDLNGHRVGYHDFKGWSTTLQTMRAATADEFGKSDINLASADFLFDSSLYNAVETGECETLKKAPR